ncbi:hypothetical protein D3C76_1444510 [compost metagenome]
MGFAGHDHVRQEQADDQGGQSYQSSCQKKSAENFPLLFLEVFAQVDHGAGKSQRGQTGEQNRPAGSHRQLASSVRAKKAGHDNARSHIQRHHQNVDSEAGEE